MKRWLLDTNTCIALLGSEQRFLKVALRLDDVDRTRVAVSCITASELFYGASRSARRLENERAVERFLLEYQPLDFDLEASRVYGELRASLARTGQLIGPLDTLIAAHALSLGAVLVTNNTREFRRVKGLKIEDWLT